MIKRKPQTNKQTNVTFTLPKEVEAEAISILGDFNDWNPEALPMKQTKKGQWQASLKLEPDQRYEFRYLLDGERWLNDDTCDHCPNAFGTTNSVLAVLREV